MAEQTRVFRWDRFALFLLFGFIMFAILHLSDNGDKARYQNTVDREQRYQDSIKDRNQVLLTELARLKVQRDSLRSIEDSLRAQGPKISERYTPIYERIDNATLRVLSAEFDSTFAANSIN